METTRYLLLAGLLILVAAVWKVQSGSGGHGNLKVTGRGSEEQILTISKGERVDLGDHVAPHGRTIFEFSADWCPGCRVLGPQLDDLVEHASDLSLRKIDIEQWKSPVAQQFSLKSIPYLMLYDRDGTLIADGTREVLEELQGK